MGEGVFQLSSAHVVLFFDVVDMLRLHVVGVSSFEYNIFQKIDQNFDSFEWREGQLSFIYADNVFKSVIARAKCLFMP